MLAPLSPLLPAAPLLGVPDGAVDGAADMPPVALDSELVPPLSLFFWQPAPAAKPAIRMPAKTARDTCRSEYRCMTPPLMSMWMEPAGAQFACRPPPPRPPATIHFSNDAQPNI
ncbi:MULTISPECIES: hypothetical protein [Burkholderia]|uniref:hypothetical protein n=1 Tax=Burkholderia TaxID=32008 RepID=UPI00211ACE81|nr:MULTISPECIES: hypothetical protein [Burkholderia]